MPATSTVTALQPGWVYIRRQKHGPVQYRYGPQSDRHSIAELLHDDKVLTARIIRRRMWRDATYVDNENARLGDLSPYHDLPLTEDPPPPV